MAFGLPVDVFDLRLYTMGLASLAVTLILAGAIAVATTAPRRVFAWLGLNALLHLLLDATEIKFGNGVHLLAPFSWRMTSFDLLPGESPVYLLLTLAGDRARALGHRPHGATPLSAGSAARAAWPSPRRSPPPTCWRRSRSSGAIEASDSYSVKTLREQGVRARAAASAWTARTSSRAPAGGFLELWTGERLRATGALPDHDATVSLHGTFLAPDVLRADTLVELRRQPRLAELPRPGSAGARVPARRLRSASGARRGARDIIQGMRSPLLAFALVALAPLSAAAAAAAARSRLRGRPFSVVEATIPEMQAALARAAASRRASSSSSTCRGSRSTRTG